MPYPKDQLSGEINLIKYNIIWSSHATNLEKQTL